MTSVCLLLGVFASWACEPEPEGNERGAHVTEGGGDGDEGTTGALPPDAGATEGSRDPGSQEPIRVGNLDPRRSLAVTEQPILQRFPLRRVLEQLVSQAEIEGMSAVQLFQQWWDTNNPAPGLGLGPNCDSELDPTYGPSINGFPFDCRPPPQEGAQASCNPFGDAGCEYIPIGLFNRFDLAPVDGSHCGEYRIIYAKVSEDGSTRDRNTIIFEAILPNPKPTQGIKGCRHIVAGWADLSREDDIEARADWLEKFYFSRHGNTPPVVHIEHYGDNALGAGQIRTNQFVQPMDEGRKWSLREFKLHKTCIRGACTLRMIPVTVKTNPFGALFDAASSDVRASQFRAAFISTAVEALAQPELPAISFPVDDAFNSPQSHASASTENDYVFHFGTGSNDFRDAIRDELGRLGSNLSPEQIVTRALTQSCAGCHRLARGADLGGGLLWPQPIGFVHVSEIDPELRDGVSSYRLSPALLDNFLPVRLQLMADYLNEVPGKYKGKTLGGRATH